MVPVAGAQDDRIDHLGGAILEGRGIAFDLLQQRHFFPVVGPVEPHRVGPVRYGHRFAAVFPALRADVFGGIAGADKQNVFPGKLAGIAEIMGMQDAAVEPLKAGEFGNIGRGKMARRHDHMIEHLGIGVILHQIMCCDGEPSIRVLHHRAHRGAEPDPVAHPRLFHPAFDVIEQHGARRIAGDLLAEMLLECVIRKFQTLFRAVRPKIAIHRAMHRLAVFIDTGPPAIVPQPTPVVLLFETDHFGDFGPFARR